MVASFQLSLTWWWSQRHGVVSTKSHMKFLHSCSRCNKWEFWLVKRIKQRSLSHSSGDFLQQICWTCYLHGSNQNSKNNAIWWSKYWGKKTGPTSQKFQRKIKKWSQSFELWPVYQQDKNLQTLTESRDEWQKKINKNHETPDIWTGKIKEQIKVLPKNKIIIK